MSKQRQTRWQPPRGITLVSFPHRPSPYGVQWRLDGKRKTKTFSTVERQLQFAKSLAGEAKRSGVEAYRLNEGEAREWRAFRATIGHDADLSAVAACWIKHRPQSTTRLPLSEAIAGYQQAQREAGNAEQSIKHDDRIFERLIDVLGDVDAATVKPVDVERFMAAQNGASAWSRRTRFTHCAALFAWMVGTRRIDSSPFDGMEAPRVQDAEPEILSLADAQRLFTKNAANEDGAAVDQRRRETLGRLALEAFAGLRYGTVSQMVAAEILDDGLRIPAAKLKTRQNQFLDGLPPNLFAWLRWSMPDQWRMDPRQYLEQKSRAFVRAGVENPGNALRKSFASYHVAAFKDAPRTSLIMCHKSPRELWNTYRGIASEADGRAYFEILPPA